MNIYMHVYKYMYMYTYVCVGVGVCVGSGLKHSWALDTRQFRGPFTQLDPLAF